ncbi:IS21 family transposase [Corallococcus sp. AB011P]|uniref:IS21 family transposase n=1 Tax=Corallococcus sp. AB011P TaxID=2316735 RepID=UPI0013152874|nr:IS21 family transposase [Corallococcus sp. AB011P]
MKTDVGRQAEVLKLHLVDGVSIRAIAKRLHMSRNTVRGLVAKRPQPRRAPVEPRTSLLMPYEAMLKQLLDDTPELRAPAVLERLRHEGYQGGVSILRERMRRIRPREKEAFLTLRFAPGEAVQVDWADFGFALPGIPRRVSAFVMALCHSRYLYLEFALSQSMGSLLRRMENGLRFFGGTTHVDIFDNMRTVVLQHTDKGVVFNTTFLDYARSRGFAVRACNVRRGNEKGRVERPIGFVRERFWPGRRFTDLMDLNVQAVKWRDDFANNRVHEVTGKVPALVFQHEEKQVLRPLSSARFETDELEGVGVTKSFRVRFDRNFYSVPPGLIGQQVVVRANDDWVRVFLGMKEVACHQRGWSVGQDIELAVHRQAALETKPGARKGTLSPVLQRMGDIATRYFKVAAAGSKSLQRESVRLVFFAEVFGTSATAAAMEDVMRSGHVGADYVEYVLRQKKGLVPSAAPLRLGQPELDEISLSEPDLSVYDTLVPSSRMLVADAVEDAP